MLVYKCILLNESNVSLLQRLDFLNGAHIETVSAVLPTLTIGTSEFMWVASMCSQVMGTIHSHSLIYDSWFCVGVEKEKSKGRGTGKDFFLYLNINNRKRQC